MSNQIPSTQRAIALASRPEGLPQSDHFKLVELPVPKPAEHQFLVRNRWMSVDPYMRGRMRAGSIIWEETVTDGLENAPAAFIDLFHSNKLGKALARL